jgi:hypothetical protein
LLNSKADAAHEAFRKRVQHTAGRYRCHDLIRLYAEDRLNDHDSPDVQREVRRRLLDGYLLSTANATALPAPNRRPVPDLPQPDKIVLSTSAARTCTRPASLAV